jgi:hypothetical protein
VTLNSIERDFLTRPSHEPWTNPPVFDHRLLERLVEKKYVASHAAARNAVYYEITDLGRAAIVDVG